MDPVEKVPDAWEVLTELRKLFPDIPERVCKVSLLIDFADSAKVVLEVTVPHPRITGGIEVKQFSLPLKPVIDTLRCGINDYASYQVKHVQKWELETLDYSGIRPVCETQYFDDQHVAAMAGMTFLHDVVANKVGT